MFFDKTRNLGGYPIKLFGNSIFITSFDPSRKSANKNHGLMEIIVQTILTKLNAVSNLTIPKGYSSSGIDSTGKPYSIFKSFFDEKYDILMKEEMNLEIWNNQIFMNMQTGFCYVSKKERISLREMIENLIPIPVFISFIAIVIIFTFCLSYLSSKNFFILFLDCLRSVTSVPVTFRPTTKSEKIIFISVLYLCMFTNLYFQSHLKSTMSTILRQPLIHSAEDVKKYNYIVLTHNSTIHYYSHILPKMMAVDNVQVCLFHLDQYNKFDCLFNCLEAQVFMNRSDLFLAKDQSYLRYDVYLVRNDFCLRDRIAATYIRLHEG